MDNHKIREIEKKDNAGVESLIRTCLLEFGGDREGTAWCDPDLGRFSEIYNKPGHKYWVAIDENENVVAIGEIGLDYYYDNSPREVQKEWFKKQIELANELKLPIIIHDRDAHQDTFEIIKSTKSPEIGCVLHCYSGNVELAIEYVKMGFYIGVGGVVTFKNAKKLKETVEAIPLERILLETDCPYMAPEPYRGKRNSSLYLTYVRDKIAEIKGVSPEEVEKITEENARRLFSKVC